MLRGLACLGMLLAAGCGDETAVVLEFTTDMDVPREFDGLFVQVQAGSGAAATRYLDLNGVSGFPQTFSVVPEEGDSVASIEISVDARLGTRTRVHRQLQSEFIEGTARRVSVELNEACVAANCGSENDCRGDGTCWDREGNQVIPDEPVPRLCSTVRPTVEPSLGCTGHTAGTSPVVISEVSLEAIAGTGFIELYNRGADEWDLSGLLIRYRQEGNWKLVAEVDDGVVPGFGFFLVTWGAGFGVGDIQREPATTAIAPSTGGSIKISCPDEEVLDTVGWGDSLHGFVEGTPASCAVALERKARTEDDGSDSDCGNGFDCDDNSTDFVCRETTNPRGTLASPKPPTCVR